MRWRRPYLVLLLFCVCAVPLAAGAALCAPPEQKRQPAQRLVMLVQSYHKEYVWCQHIENGVRRALRGQNVQVSVQYMDAKRNPAPDRLRQKADQLAALIRAKKPQVVIAADDAAQEYLVVPYLKNHAPPQVIFCGVNATPSRYGFPASNVSGVRERWHFSEGFALLKRIKPNMRTVAVLSDDSESSQYVLSDMDQEGRAAKFALKVLRVERLHTLQQWREAVLREQSRADSLALGTYYTLVDEQTGKVADADQVAAWNSANIRKPSLGFADYSREHGLLCGILESGDEQGYLAGVMAREVLERGVNAGALPLRINRKGLVLLNLKTADRLNILIPYDIIKAAEIVIQ